MQMLSSIQRNSSSSQSSFPKRKKSKKSDLKNACERCLIPIHFGKGYRDRFSKIIAFLKTLIIGEKFVSKIMFTSLISLIKENFTRQQILHIPRFRKNSNALLYETIILNLSNTSYLNLYKGWQSTSSKIAWLFFFMYPFNTAWLFHSEI